MGNANSGRRPKPTALKLLQGNPGKRKLNEREPKPPEGPVSTPETLSKSARVVWAEQAPLAIHMGTLTPADVAAFATLCELEATRRAASREKDKRGFAVLTATGAIHPAVKLERNTAAALRPYYEKFGLEPVGRARMSVPAKDDAPTSKWAGALA